MILCFETVNDKCYSSIYIKLFSAGRDYVELMTDLNFDMGQQSGFKLCINVTILNDATFEVNQTFSLQLRILTPSMVSIADGGGIAILLIVDDEGMILIHKHMLTQQFCYNYCKSLQY